MSVLAVAIAFGIGVALLSALMIVVAWTSGKRAESERQRTRYLEGYRRTREKMDNAERFTDADRARDAMRMRDPDSK